MVFAVYEFLILPVYNITLHPLAKFPGPKTWAATGFVEMYHVLKGDLPFAIQKLHQSYGHVVRTGPNEMSYISEEAWDDIHGRYDGRVQLKKAKEFTPTKLPNGAQGLVFVHDDADHARLRCVHVHCPKLLSSTPLRQPDRQATATGVGLSSSMKWPESTNKNNNNKKRRNFSHGFSDKALKRQELLIGGFFDTLICRLREAEGKPVNMMKWYQLTTFDIIGKLTFGEGFNCLHEDTKLYVRESHLFWVMLDTRTYGVIINALGQVLCLTKYQRMLTILARPGS